MIEPHAAVRAEPAFHCLCLAGLSGKHLRCAVRDAKILLRDNCRHSECRAGLPLTLRAVTGIDGCWGGRDLIAHPSRTGSRLIVGNAWPDPSQLLLVSTWSQDLSLCECPAACRHATVNRLSRAPAPAARNLRLPAQVRARMHRHVLRQRGTGSHNPYWVRAGRRIVGGRGIAPASEEAKKI